jgi:hypothetical protein
VVPQLQLGVILAGCERELTPLTCHHQTGTHVDAERFHSAYRLALGIVLVYVLLMLVPQAVQFSKLVAGGRQRPQTREAASRQSAAASRQKLSAANLESALRQAHRLGADAQLRCEPADRDWDYVCSYIATALQSRTRLQFGVDVDAKRLTKASSVVPVGTAVPPPQ